MAQVTLIPPSVKVLDINKLFNTDSNTSTSERMMEYVGRVCYNSYDKMTPLSHEKFNAHSAKKSHRSIFEFGQLRLTVSLTSNEYTDLIYRTLDTCPYLKYYTNSNYNNNIGMHYNVTIEGSPRAFLELLEAYAHNQLQESPPIALFYTIKIMLYNICPNIIHNWATYSSIEAYAISHTEMVEDLDSTFIDITHLTAGINKDKKILVELVTDKGLHNELVRHRPCSHMASSARYIRYEDGMNVVVSSKDLTDELYVYNIAKYCSESLNNYLSLTDSGIAPQCARTVLPIGMAMTSFIYASVEEWEHIFRLRTASAALPLAQEVTKEIRQQMINKGLL